MFQLISCSQHHFLYYVVNGFNGASNQNCVVTLAFLARRYTLVRLFRQSKCLMISDLQRNEIRNYLIRFLSKLYKWNKLSKIHHHHHYIFMALVKSCLVCFQRSSSHTFLGRPKDLFSIGLYFNIFLANRDSGNLPSFISSDIYRLLTYHSSYKCSTPILCSHFLCGPDQ